MTLLDPSPSEKPLVHYEKREWISITELVKAARCPRLFFYQTGLGLRTRSTKIALKYGEAIHAAAPHVLEGEFERGYQAFLDVWLPSGLEDMQDKKRNMSCAREMLWNFHLTATSPGFPYKILKPPQVFKVKADRVSPYELPFVLPLDGLSIPLIGRVDGLCMNAVTNRLWVLEYKTTSELSDRFFEAFTFNCQAIGYTLAASTTLNTTIDGCMLQGLFVSHVNQKSFVHPIWVSDGDISLWKKWAVFWGNFILECERRAVDEKTTDESWLCDISACNQIGQFGLPGYNCEFTSLCKAKNWRTLTDQYEVERHIPFQVDGVMD